MPTPQPPTSSALRDRLAAALTEHLPLKAAALFLTLVLWMVVRVKEPNDEFIPVKFAPSLDSSLVLRGQMPTVRALVIGSGQDILKLYRNPPVIRKAVTGDVPDVLHLDLAPQDVDIPADIDVIVRDVQPRTVTLRFAPEAERLVPVRSTLRFVEDSGVHISGSPQIEPDSVRVVGDRRLVARLESVPTVANDIVVHDAMDVVVPLDTSGLGLRVRPSAVRVSVPATRGPLPAPRRERRTS